MSSLEQQNSAAPAPRGPARAELVGSMVRPPEVIEAFRRVFPSRDALGEHPRGQGSQEDRDQLVEVATAAIASIVRRQVDAGVDAVVNGEFNRWTWWMGLYGALEGFATDREPIVARDGRGGTRTLYVPRIDRPVRRAANPAAEEARVLASITDRPFRGVRRASRRGAIAGRRGGRGRRPLLAARLPRLYLRGRPVVVQGVPRWRRAP